MFFKKCTIRYLICWLMVYFGIEQNVTNAQINNFSYKLSLDTVSFSGAGLIRIRNDDNTFFYDAPHWTTRTQKPVGYRSASRPIVSCSLKIEGVCNTNLFVKGEASNGMKFLPKRLVLDSARKKAIYVMEANVRFDSAKVNYFEDFNITWSYADTSNSTKWAIIGVSTNKMYVTKGRPLQIYDTGLDTATFHTIIQIGCKYAKGDTLDSTIVAKVYKQFQTLNIMSVDNRRSLQYWGNNYGSPYINSIPTGNIDHLFYTKGLLKYSEGTCNAWSLFFIEILRTQGIGNAEFTVLRWTPNETLGTANANILTQNLSSAGLTLSNNRNAALLPAFFFVKNWNPADNRFFELDGYSAETYRPGGLLSEIDAQGIKAQSMANPYSTFTTHVIVRYKSLFYDPSYGTAPTNDLAVLQNNSISFFGGKMLLQLGNEGGKPKPNEKPAWFIWVKPTSVNDKLTFTIDTTIHHF